MATRKRRSKGMKGKCKCVNGRKVCWTRSGKLKKGKRKRCGR